MKKYLVGFLIICLLLSAAACAKADPNAGKYVCVAVNGGEKKEPDDEWIVLETNGKGSIHINLELNMNWRIESGSLIIDTLLVENTYYGTFIDGIIVLTVDETDYTFVKEGMETAWAEAQKTNIVPEATEQIPVDASAVGHYACTSVTGKEAYSLVGNQWIDLFEDGTAVVYFGLKYPGSWNVQNGQLTITLNNEEVYSGSIQNEEMTLLGETTYILQKTGEPGTDSGDVYADLKTPLHIGSQWEGTLKVRNQDGEGILKDGEFPIIARIDENENGPFFEVHYQKKPNDTPIVFFYIDMRQNYVTPLIDEEAENAWIFEELLDEDEAFDLTMFLDSENSMDFYYEYDTKDEEADLHFSFYPEGNG